MDEQRSNNDQRFTELEIKLAYQEDIVKSLNDVVCRQQASIERLEQTCRHLVQRLQDATQNSQAESFDEEKPPHY